VAVAVAAENIVDIAGGRESEEIRGEAMNLMN
jgi:hypothetical protein